MLKLSPLLKIYLTCIFGDYYYLWEILALDMGWLPFCNDIKICIKDVSQRNNFAVSIIRRNIAAEHRMFRNILWLNLGRSFWCESKKEAMH